MQPESDQHGPAALQTGSLDPGSFDAVTFDCFGTLIDWPAGILGVLRPMGERHHLQVDDADLLARYAQLERDIESRGYMPYREVLSRVMRSLFGGAAGHEAEALAGALGRWQPFPDTPGGLARLGAPYRLGVLSNVDDDLFEPVLETLGRPFEVVVTAEQVRSYKPGAAHFKEALRRLGLAPDRVLHVAESRFHDVAPAKALGMCTVWVNRGASASGGSDATADLEVRDLTHLCALLGL